MKYRLSLLFFTFILFPSFESKNDVQELVDLVNLLTVQPTMKEVQKEVAKHFCKDGKLDQFSSCFTRKRLVSGLHASKIIAYFNLEGDQVYYNDELYKTLHLRIAGYGHLNNDSKRYAKVDQDFSLLKVQLSKFYAITSGSSSARGQSPGLEQFFLRSKKADSQDIQIELLKVKGGCLNQAELFITILKKPQHHNTHKH